MPKRQYANNAEHADAAINALDVLIFILLIFFKFLLLVEQQFQ